ncbi:response regulator [Paramagnetospirillum marisnigri]|uniref:diguanylate cyclase n=1 Tax=Paramagnetospirillum marisnigri TaxID=1285242 RepID=A0A178MIP0_9PROT|nr:diguanylate cyclase [Paramagnetospirillum marisnigri]OAN48037.1 response regulator [Paramagnetospirillum marisnigri]
MPDTPPHLADGQSPSGGPQKLRDRLRRAFRPTTPHPRSEPWPVLVVDDEPDIHEMTRLLLRDLSFKDRPFEVISAHSATEARTILARHPDIPVILLDVVMETPDAGLALVRHIREELGNRRIAIVLRTGQPAEAPEREVMLAYDINDYRAKTELTAQKLFTSLVGGLRSWANQTTIETLNASLEHRVAERTGELDRARRFAETLVDMLPHPLWYKDGDGRMRIVNRAFREMFGLAPGEDAMPPQLAELDSQGDGLAPGGDMQFEASLSLPGGPRTLMIATGRLTEDGDARPGTIGMITDISERKCMEQQLRRMATVDDLTCTLNRRAFFAAATLEMERSDRYGSPVSVLMFDLDHFKQVNDRHGHAVGDAALRAAAAALRANLREIDILGRLGGEEFAVLLPETTQAGAAEVAERLRQAMAQAAIALPDGQPPLFLTASLGVAERAADEMSVDQVLARADAALYRAKDAGRNRISA